MARPLKTKQWAVASSNNPVHTHVLFAGRPLATLNDYKRLSKLCAKGQRDDHEPETLDFDFAQAPEIYEQAQTLTEEANKTFGFNLTGWQQQLRFNTYGKSKLFTIHNDYAGTDNSKLAFVHMVEPPAKGGELLIISSPHIIRLSLKGGETVFFPAYLMHEVLPVEEGKRVVLVGWATGSMFK